MQSKQIIRFSRKGSQDFFKILNKRVNKHFKKNQLLKTGNWKLYIKSIIMFSLWIIPYVLIFSIETNQWYKLLLCAIMGIGMAGVGMNVMHDGNHGSFSKYSFINKIMGGTMYFLAGNVFNWKIKHNILHHTFTNIHGHDEDLEAGIILRFSKHAKWKPYHKFQHYYSLFLYGLLTIKWAIFSDFKEMSSHLKRKLSYNNSKKPFFQWTGLIITKIMYFSIWLIIPILVLKISWWKILIGFFIMHYIAGIILSLVFQLAHVIEYADMPLPKKDDKSIKNTWIIHQLLTTVNFSTKNKFINWFTGGLNHQIEHHIFPNISHIHYTKISKIVKKTAKEFNLPYKEYASTKDAIFSHFRFLKQMGMNPV